MTSGLQHLEFIIQHIQIQMLHELLFCLLGKTGSIIKESANGEEFLVDPSLSMFSNAQVMLIERLAKVGHQYKSLQQFVSKEMLYLDQQPYGEESSVYRKALAAGIKGCLEEYSQVIIAIERDFLKNKHFTISNIRADICDFQALFEVLIELTVKVRSKRGGIVADLIQEAIHVNNLNVQTSLKSILNECCKVFLNQISAWILYGKIIDVGGQFFVHRVTTENQKASKLPNRTQIEITDWDSYTLEISMVPRSLVQSETAEKILFIGKGVKLLRSLERRSGFPRKNLQQKMKEISSATFDPTHFQAVIESLRHSVAQEMIEIIMGQEKLMKELNRINGYYLVRKGDFYHLFLQECKGLENIISKQKAQKKINEKYLQNTFMRLDNFQDAKTISFQLKQLGFIYLGFKHISHLCLVGNLHIIDGKHLRFNRIGALWHKTKQLVEADFNMIFSFSFKRNSQKAVDKKASNSWRKAAFNLVIHNSKDLASRVHDAPVSLQQISEYICIRFGVQEDSSSDNGGDSKSYVHVVSMDPKKTYKEELHGELIFSPKKHLNFLDEKPQQVHVKYSNSLLTLEIKKEGLKEGYSIKTNISLSSYVGLEMGRANIGFIPELADSNLAVELENWEMVCKTANNPENNWSDLCLNYKVSWPINLIITSDLLESFLRIHKFLLPIRKIQIQLEGLWIRIPRRLKANKQVYIRRFERKISVFRWQLCLVVNHLWGYFQTDVIETTWNKLKEAVQKIDDFEDLRAMINKYVKSIGTMFFFNVPKIQKFFHEIIRFCRNFIVFFNDLEREDVNEEHQYNLDQLSDQFVACLDSFHNQLKKWSQINSSNLLYHLIQRISSTTFSLKESEIRPL